MTRSLIRAEQYFIPQRRTYSKDESSITIEFPIVLDGIYLILMSLEIFEGMFNLL